MAKSGWTAAVSAMIEIRHRRGSSRQAAGPLAALALAVALACGPPGVESPPVDEVVELPPAEEWPKLDGPPPEQWCSDFGDPQLADLVEQAFSGSPDLRAAWARVRQAEAAAEIAGARLWPTVEAQLQASRTEPLDGEGGRDLPFPGGGVGGGGGTGGGAGFTAFGTGTFYTASLGASYEIDAWGRLRSRRAAAVLEAEAARDDVRALSTTLTSRLAEAYFDLAFERASLALLGEQVEVSERYLQLTLLRFGQGATNALDVTQQRQQLESLRGLAARAESRAATATHRLAILLGRPPRDLPDLAVPDDVPDLPPLPAAGVPADLLERRPDLRAARARLAAADRRTAAALADKLPGITLSAQLFANSSSLSDLLDDIFWSVSGSLAQTLFDAGRRDQEVERARAAADEQLYAYAQTLLTALREVRDALALEDGQREVLESLHVQAEAAGTALGLARARYVMGAADYLRVLTALQSLQRIQQDRLDARRQLLSHRIQLCRALGGAPTASDPPPAARAGPQGSR
jgi:NodT family efflux transporter outer membrane factor (OMF) lipoprotein